MSGLVTDRTYGEGNANATIVGPGGTARLGSALMRLLQANTWDDGDPDYQTCKDIYVYHPLGARITDEPLVIAQSQRRMISVPDGPEEVVKEQFEKTWEEMSLDDQAFSLGSVARIYGIGSLVFGCVGKDGKVIPPSEPIDLFKLHQYDVYFSVMDPLNTSGSLMLDQNPNSPEFQKARKVMVAGQEYHTSRGISLMNERPIYLAYTDSAFGFTGRSAYQRAFYPLKSFINSMRTDDLIVRKAGVFIVMMEQAGSIINNIMGAISGIKRRLLKEAEVDDVISVGQQDKVETLNMMNIDGAYGLARTNILENIAAAVPMPAILLNSQTYVDGFGEGSEDAKKVAHYIHRVRLWWAKAYAFLDRICMHKAWSPDFYKTIQERFPEYRDMSYQKAFYRWKNSFRAEWPSLLIEPESERAKAEDVKLKAMIATLQVLLPIADPQNAKAVLQFFQDNVNEMKLLFTNPLVLDFESLEQFIEERQQQMAEQQQAATEETQANAVPKAAPPESSRDSQSTVRKLRPHAPTA
jgi:hypothetical protein